MLNPIDTTADPAASLMRRVQALEERAEALAARQGSVVAFFVGNVAQTTAKFNELENAAAGSIFARIEENEVGGARRVALKFPAPYGWYSA